MPRRSAGMPANREEIRGRRPNLSEHPAERGRRRGAGSEVASDRPGWIAGRTTTAACQSGRTAMHRAGLIDAPPGSPTDGPWGEAVRAFHARAQREFPAVAFGLESFAREARDDGRGASSAGGPRRWGCGLRGRARRHRGRRSLPGDGVRGAGPGGLGGAGGPVHPSARRAGDDARPDAAPKPARWHRRPWTDSSPPRHVADRRRASGRTTGRSASSRGWPSSCCDASWTARGRADLRREVPASFEAGRAAATADAPAARTGDPLRRLLDAEAARALDEAFRAAWKDLTPKESLAVLLKYRDDLPQTAIARVLDVGEPRVSRILSAALEKIRAAIRTRVPEGLGLDAERVRPTLRDVVAATLASSGGGAELPRGGSSPP